MKIPIVSRKYHNNEVRKRESQIYSLKQKINTLEQDLIIANHATDKILPRLTNIREPIRNEEFSTYRICTDLHRDMVERCFTHGGDSNMIRYFAERVGKTIERKIVEFNFARCNRI